MDIGQAIGSIGDSLSQAFSGVSNLVGQFSNSISAGHFTGGGVAVVAIGAVLILALVILQALRR